jgi:hypothetical protein
MSPAERDELLIRVDERTLRQEGWTKTHVELHTRLSLAFIGAVVSTILALATTTVSLIVVLCNGR